MATCSPPPGDWTGEEGGPGEARQVPSAGNRQCPGMQTVLKARGREILLSGARLKLGQ